MNRSKRKINCSIYGLNKGGKEVFVLLQRPLGLTVLITVSGH
jgi:hypothetical protein